jgi:XapX domain-containing protein
MKLYLLSLGAGLLVGVIYSLLGVRSPPPLVALVGLLGILVGEQVVPIARRAIQGRMCLLYPRQLRRSCAGRTARRSFLALMELPPWPIHHHQRQGCHAGPREPRGRGHRHPRRQVSGRGQRAEVRAAARQMPSHRCRPPPRDPGLIDSHMHIIRGGLNFNMELRWDGVPSLEAMAMLKAQVDRTPAPQWVRVVGGFTEHQFAEKRLPTLAELNAVAPDTPVFILHLYDRALLNAARCAWWAIPRTRPTRRAADCARCGGQPHRLLLAQPNATILCHAGEGAKGEEYQINSTAISCAMNAWA